MEDLELQSREIFAEAMGLASSEWPGFLERRCTNKELRTRVQKLLDHYVASEEFLSRPATEMFPNVAGSLGQQIAEFRIVREIGRGGMGVVYLADDVVLKRSVALKVLGPGFGAEDGVEGAAAERFRKEALAVARLSHPGIVSIYRTGEERGYSYIAMEYVDGETLRARRVRELSGGLKRDAASIAECARLVSEVADALDHAHRNGVIHRDVKPSNILVDRAGRARLTDFGIAKLVSERTVVKSGDIAGSYPYMSPEQARVQVIEIDHRSDIFSLGVVLYELLSGKRPFDGTTPEEILRALGAGSARSIRLREPSVPVDLATICHKAIEKLPRERYQTAAHMAADLRCYLVGDPILASPPSARRRVTHWIKKRRGAFAIGAAVALFVVATGLAVSVRHYQNERLAWVRIDGTCEVRVQQVDSGSLRLRAPEHVHRISGGGSLGLEPGAYRLTFCGDGENFAEADLQLLVPGSEHQITMRVLGKSEERGTGEFVRMMEGSCAEAEDMARVAGGEYDCGAGGATKVLMRRQSVNLEPFYIDRKEVSNREYLAFLYDSAGSDSIRARLRRIEAREQLDASVGVAGSDHHPNTPDYWKIAGYDPSLAERPVVGIRLIDASAFARWKGKRLPSMFEWEAAARGQAPGAVPRFEYPGGRSMLDFADLAAPDSYLRLDQAIDAPTRIRIYRELSVPVGAPDKYETPAGVAHMYDNVREITSSVDLENLDGIAKGRGWLDEPSGASLAQSWTFPLSERSLDRGFRCARSAAPVAVR